MSIQGQIIVTILCYVVSSFFLRGFIYGAIRYQLNNSAYKKRKKGQTFKEWLLFSRYKEEIPMIFLILYYSVQLIHSAVLIICIFLYIIKQPSEIGGIIVRAVACFDTAWLIIIALFFWSPGREYAYGRWITKKRGKKRDKK